MQLSLSRKDKDMKTIYELRYVNDLVDGEKAVPETKITYKLRTFDNTQLESGAVEYVVRDGDRLYAKMTTGYSFRINGTGSHVLVPKVLHTKDNDNEK